MKAPNTDNRKTRRARNCYNCDNHEHPLARCDCAERSRAARKREFERELARGEHGAAEL